MNTLPQQLNNMAFPAHSRFLAKVGEFGKITRAQAQQAGAMFYFGNPCKKRDHPGWRYASNKQCAQCLREANIQTSVRKRNEPVRFFHKIDRFKDDLELSRLQDPSQADEYSFDEEGSYA